jgi:hypothetical protein
MRRPLSIRERSPESKRSNLSSQVGKRRGFKKDGKEGRHFVLMHELAIDGKSISIQGA